MELRGRIALVTGGAHRVGRALSVALAEAGMRVAINYNSASAEADALVAELAAQGHETRAYRADLTQPEAPASLVTAVTRDFGGLDVLVNSAAVMRRTPVDEVSVAEWDDIFALNLRAPFFMSQAAHPWLRKANGNIVNLADLAAFETWPDYIPHGISKAAVVQMTRAMARVYAPEVRVNAIAPGAVLLPDAWDESARAHFAQTTPLHRIGSPDDVVGAMMYLLQSDYVTGDTLLVDGGRHVRS
ncbi:MAG TPA: SDR family oxidoreductase [Gemmatimonadaceae bacterium]|jgi:pteridine reductase